jgi:TRAP-type mannitol/chloroaromatic compound transport system permease small subunit
MTGLLALSRGIDRLNTALGHAVYWLVLAAVLISAGNAVIRYSLDTSSNAWLELQWYIFSAIFLLAAGYTLLNNEHIRIDIVYGTFSRRTQIWIDIFGTIFFFLPTVVVIGWLSVPFVLESIRINELSSNAGGLIRWPVKILLPIGFAFLFLQGVSELVKRMAFLMGLIPDPVPSKSEVEAEIEAHKVQVER